MHIVLISPTPWRVPGQGEPASGHRWTPLLGTLAQCQAQVRTLRPEVLLLRDCEQTPAVVADIDALCTALPQLAVVPLCPEPAPAFLMSAMRAGVREVIANAEPATLAGLLARLQERQAGRPALPVPGRCLGFVPTKGGEGASSTAANLAVALASLPAQRVLLMDVSLPFGDLALCLSPEPATHDLSEVAGEIDRIDAALLGGLTQHLTAQLHFIGAPSTLQAYLQLRAEQVLRLIRVAQQHYDFVLLDLRLDAIGLGALELLDQLVVVGRLSLPSLKGAGHLLALWEQLGHPASQLQLALRAPRFEGIDAAAAAQALGRPVDRLMPSAGQLLASAVTQGRAAVLLQPRSDYARAMATWALELTGQVAVAPEALNGRSLWQRLKIR
jgi:pilus assembly protein CpaE